MNSKWAKFKKNTIKCRGRISEKHQSYWDEKMFVAMTVQHWIIWWCLRWRTCVSLSLVPEELKAPTVWCRGWGPSAVFHDSGQFDQSSPLSHNLDGVKGAATDWAGYYNQSVESVLVPLWIALSPADHYLEDHWCHHSLIKGPQQWPAHTKIPTCPACQGDLDASYKTSQRCWSSPVVEGDWAHSNRHSPWWH